MRRITTAPRAHLGATLLEVLIALTLVSGGVMATTLLYINSLKYSKMAQIRGTAADLALEMADRMRANVQIVYAFEDPYEEDPAAVLVPTCSGACSSADIAAIDIAEMRNRVRLSLPGGNLRITSNAADPGNLVNVWIMWTDPDTPGGESLQCEGAGEGAGPSCVSLRVAL